MRGHEAEAVATPAIAGDGQPEERQEELAVVVIEEDRPARVSAGGDVVDGAGRLYPERARHEAHRRRP
jgi:hypothetical protein